MPSQASRDPALRGNGWRFECFLGPSRARRRFPTTLTVHRKSDGAWLAAGILHRHGRVLRFALSKAERDLELAAVHIELTRLLTGRYPRHRVEVVIDKRRCLDPDRRLKLPPRRWVRRALPDLTQRRYRAVCRDIPADYGPRRQLLPQREPRWLGCAGRDHAGRPCWLAPEALDAWHRLKSAARADGVTLQLVSGFRSAEHQARILAAKRARGIAMRDILTVNAAPGYSEHHTGRAVDLTTPGCRAAEPEFEDTDAFRWLQRRAGDFGFRMSYPRGNPHGIVPEPWHWYFAGFDGAGDLAS